MLRAVVRAYLSAFSGLSRPVWVLSLATLVNRSGTMVMPFLVLFLIEERGFTTAEAGRALAVYGVAALPGAYLGGWLSDRAGARRVMIWSLAATGAGFLLLGQMEGEASIFATISGIALLGETFRPAVGAALATAAPPGERTRAFALNRLAVNLGMTLGPAAGGFLALRSYDWLFLVDGATCLAAAGVVALWFREPPRQPAAPVPGAPPERSPWRDGPFLAFIGLLALLSTVFFQLVGTFPLTLRDVHGLSEAGIGLALAVNTLLIVLFEMVLIDKVQRFDPLAMVGLGALFIGLGLALLPFGSGFAWVAATVAVWTVGEMLALPLAGGVVADRAGEANQGRYMGLLQVAFGVAFIVAPLAGTWTYQRFGPTVLGLGCGAVGVVTWAGFHLLARTFRHSP